MHYCCLVITKEFPTDTVLEKALKPFNKETAENYPAFTWDWYQVGGRYNGSLKLKIDDTDEKYRWNFYTKPYRNGRLFRSYLLTKMEEFSKGSFMYSEEDYFRSMGSRENFLFIDGGYIPDLLNFESVECFCYLDKDGNAYSRERWTGDNFEKNDKFDEQLKAVKDNSKDCYACIVDLHD